MESKVATPIENSKFKPKWENKLFWAELLMGVSFVFFVILFCFNQPWFNWNDTIDAGKWSSFGEFIGGLLGTACAYISLRLLVKNLREQEKSNGYLKESNDRISEVSELQLVHEEIKTLLVSYNSVIRNYKIGEKEVGQGKEGQEAIKHIATDLFDSYKDPNNSSIEKRIDEARILFDAKYVTYRDTMAVHFRLLYQMFQIIWLSELKGEKKAMMSKMLRSQFTEHELLLLRYNCLTDNGRKMRLYVNQFNLLKHLPVTHLLEFKNWVKDLDKEQRNRLDSECIVIRKCIKNLLLRDKGQEEIQKLDYSDKYKAVIKVSSDKKICSFDLVRNTEMESSNDTTSMNKVFDTWKDEQIQSFFIDYFKYIFDCSNFSLFNNLNEIEVRSDIKTEENGKKHTIWTMVKKDKSPLVISMSQTADPQR